MSLDFPSSPVDGQVFGSYVWSASKGAWQSREESAAVAVMSPTTPTSASPGDIWVNTSEGTSFVYYDDGTTSQWVELISSREIDISGKANLSGGNTFSGTQTFSTPIAVSSGGTGASNLTASGYLKGNGTSAITSQSGIPAGDITSGSLAVARGGTGLSTGSGLATIIPTSASMSSGTVTRDTTTGRVTFSGTGGIILNGVFSDTYTNYIVKIEMTGTSQPNDYVYWRFTQNGTATSVAAYYGGAAYNQGTTLSTFQSNQGTAYVSMGYAAASGGNTYSINVFAPYNSGGTNRPTVTFHSCYENTSVWGSSKWNGAATFDGFWFYPAGAGTITGNVTVYGQR